VLLFRWLFVRVELLGTLLSLFIAILLVHKINSIDAGLAGIALTFSTSLLEYVYWLMRQSTTVDMYFESVERINEYLNMPQEPPGIVEGSRPPASVNLKTKQKKFVSFNMLLAMNIIVAYSRNDSSKGSYGQL
jgi:ABC-type multidrug transport system fused ATPase/permease subunit